MAMMSTATMPMAMAVCSLKYLRDGRAQLCMTADAFQPSNAKASSA